MATTENFFNGTGSQTEFTYTFPTLLDADVKASVLTTAGTGFVVTTAFTLLTSPTRVKFNTAPVAGTNNVRIFRDTNVDAPKAVFAAGSSIRASDLNNNMDQVLYSNQEKDRPIATTDLKDDSVTTAKIVNSAVTTAKIADGNVSRAKIAADAIDGTKIDDNAIDSEHYTDQSIDTAHIANLAVGPSQLANNACTELKLADNSVGNRQYIDASIDTVHVSDDCIETAKIANNAVTTAKITDANVTTAKIAADAVTGAKIADDQVSTEHYAPNSVDTAAIAANAVTTAEITDGAVKTAKITDGDITTAKIADDAITGDKLANNLDIPDTNKIRFGASSDLQIYHDPTIAPNGDNYIKAGSDLILQVPEADANGGNIIFNTDASTPETIARFKGGTNPSCELYFNNSKKIETTSAGATVTGTLTATLAANSIDSDNYVDGSIDRVHLAADIVDGTKIADDAIGAEHIQANAVGTSEIADAELVTLAGMPSGTASILADSTALTSTTAELNLLDGKSVVTSVSGSSTDVQLPTAKAVNDQIVSLLNDAGGFVPINDELKFPNANPDPNDGAGTIVSIADAGGIVVNGSGVSTTGRTLGGSTVTINGIDSSLHNTTIAAGKGMLVQTTSTLNTYDYHRLVVDEAGVATAQTLVTDFNERYRVASSAPSSSLDEGDLYFDTSANKMKVYDGSAWGEVTSTGDFKYLFLCPAGGSGAPTLNGSIATYDLREGSNSGSAASVTKAAQLLVSINGVVQKANTGTSAPAEGFAMVDANTIIFGANLASGDSVFIVQFGSALSLNDPADNSVSSAKIQNGAVTNAKLGADAVTGAKIADDAVAQEHIADASVDEARLQISNSPTNGQFLSAQSGNTGGLTWAAVPAGVGGATGVDFNDSVKARFGTGNDLAIYHNGTDAMIDAEESGDTRDLYIKSGDGAGADPGTVQILANDGNKLLRATNDAGVELFFDNTLKLNIKTDQIETRDDIVPNVDSADSIGTNTKRYANGYFDTLYGDGSNLTGISGGVSSDAQYNTLAGTNAGDSFTGTDANQNSLFGYNAGTAITTADENVYLGYNAGLTSNTGSYNVAVGSKAFDAASTAGWSVAIGRSALGATTTGNDNTAVGNYAANSNTTGNSLTAVGKTALGANTTGTSNVAVGVNALAANTTAAHNVAVGTDALKTQTDGGSNVAVGNESLYTLDDAGATANTAVGHKSGRLMTTGNHNTLIGHQAGIDMTTGFYNSIVGSRAGENITTGGYNVAMGMDTLKTATTANYNTAIGTNAAKALTTGHSNTAVGYAALDASTTGESNTAIGYHAAGTLTDGQTNTAVGNYALYTATTPDNNVAIGHNALYYTTTGGNNVAVGKSAGISNTTGDVGVHVGYNAGQYNTTGTQNTYVGAWSGYSGTTSAYNTCVGYYAGSNLTTGGPNNCFGVNAGRYITTGAHNVCIGNHSASYVTGFATGNYCIYVGSYARASATDVSNELVFGYNTTGKGASTAWIGQNPYHYGNTTTWYTTSDRRIKKNIVDNNVGLEKINQIQVRNFEYRKPEEVDPELSADSAIDKEGIQLGVIAQELEEILPEMVHQETTGCKTVDANDLTWYLVNAVKELSTKNDALEARLATLEAA